MRVPNRAKPIRKLMATGTEKARSRNSRSGRTGSAALVAETSQAAAAARASSSQAGWRVWPSRTTPITAGRQREGSGVVEGRARGG
ncbi:hypothetical protein GCM10020219_053350 [Nonomuraea dietziae]